MPPTAGDLRLIGSGRGNLLAFAGAVTCSQRTNEAVKTEMHVCMAGWLYLERIGVDYIGVEEGGV